MGDEQVGRTGAGSALARRASSERATPGRRRAAAAIGAPRLGDTHPRHFGEEAAGRGFSTSRPSVVARLDEPLDEAGVEEAARVRRSTVALERGHDDQGRAGDDARRLQLGESGIVEAQLAEHLARAASSGGERLSQPGRLECEGRRDEPSGRAVGC